MKQRSKSKCTICRAHNVISDLKGHKHKCTFRNCNCDICQVKSICLGKIEDLEVINLVIEGPTITPEKQQVLEIGQFIISADFPAPILLITNNSSSITIGNTLFIGFAHISGSKFN